MATGMTERDRAKADRHRSLVRAAARLFAERGYSGVSLEELGAAVGVSGPAVYRHFASKQALLAEILVGVSERLLEGGRAVADREPDQERRLIALIDFHVDFALSDADVIRVQDRDLANLSPAARSTVRELQRAYVDVWTDALRALHPARGDDEIRVRAHAALGLINSTPHSVRAGRGLTDAAVLHGILRDMALAALVA